MLEHTKEPWAQNGLRVESAQEHGWANDGWVIFEALGPDAEANARRIVACVNACAGIPTELIEEGGFAAVPVATHREVKTQRDELLAELKEVREYVARKVDALKSVLDDPRDWRLEQDDLDRIDALIARMEEGR